MLFRGARRSLGRSATLQEGLCRTATRHQEKLDEVVDLRPAAGEGSARGGVSAPLSCGVDADHDAVAPVPCALQRAPGVALRARRGRPVRATRRRRRARRSRPVDEGTSRATAASAACRRHRRVAAEQHVRGLVGRRCRLSAVHQLGQLVGQRPLRRRVVRAPARARRSSASTSSSGRVENRSRYVPIIVVVGLDPELAELVRRRALGIEPHRAARPSCRTWCRRRLVSSGQVSPWAAVPGRSCGSGRCRR